MWSLYVLPVVGCKEWILLPKVTVVNFDFVTALIEISSSDCLSQSLTVSRILGKRKYPFFKYYIGAAFLQLTKNHLALISGIRSHWLSSHLVCAVAFRLLQYCSVSHPRRTQTRCCHWQRKPSSPHSPLQTCGGFLDTDNQVAVLWQPVSKVMCERVCLCVCLRGCLMERWLRGRNMAKDMQL